MPSGAKVEYKAAGFAVRNQLHVWYMRQQLRVLYSLSAMNFMVRTKQLIVVVFSLYFSMNQDDPAQ